MKKALTIIAAGMAFLPATVLAQNYYLSGGPDAFSVTIRIIDSIGAIVRLATPIVFALAILAFFWGIFRYVWAGSGEGKVEAKRVMLWSLVAIFVMVSLYGIIALFRTTLNVNQQSNFTVPTIQ